MKYFVTILIFLSSVSLQAQTNGSSYTRAWGTYFDAETEDDGNFEISDMDTDGNGNIWLVGTVKGVTTTDFITSDAYQSETGNNNHAGFIVKFSSEGSLLYGSFFGGEMGAKINTISITENEVYIAGGTKSTTGIATAGAYQEVLTVNTDSNGNSITSAPFIAKFNGLGVLQWATYYQGNRADYIYSIQGGYNNDFFIWGGTTSSNLSTMGAFRESIPDPIPDGEGGSMVPTYPFLTRFSDSGQPFWTTYYGPDIANLDFGNPVSNMFQGMAVDPIGNVYVAGFSKDTEGYYGTPESHQPMGAGNGDFFVSKFSTSGRRMWSTYFGGSEGEAIGRISIPRNSLIISGMTLSSSNIATPGTWQDSFEANTVNSFVTRFDLEGHQEWGTYLRGYSSTILTVDVNFNQEIFVYGGNNPDNNIEYEGSYQEAEIGDSDNRILKLDPSGSTLEWGSYYGGTQREFIPVLWNSALSVTDNDEIYIIGTTESTEDIATENAFQSSFIDGFGTFIAKFEPCPDPVLPVAETSQNFQPGETLGDLEVETVEWSGSDPIVTWYADAAGTQILSPDTELEAETTYYVSQKIQGCDESGLLAISVETLSVSENKLAKTALFPNPNDGDFYLSGLPNGPLEIVMYDILGKKVYRQNLQQAGQRHRISPAIHFSDGVYFLKIYNGYTSKVFKVVIQ